MSITQNPSDVLRQKAQKVEEINQETLADIKKIKSSLKKSKLAVAVAAPQIGISKQIAVTGYKAKNEKEISVPEFILINPKIISHSNKTEESDEGCLSFVEPEIRGVVPRYQEVTVKAINEKGEEIEIKAEGFFARVLQHEIDHLNGVLFVDRADPQSLYRPEKKDEKPKQA